MVDYLEAHISNITDNGTSTINSSQTGAPYTEDDLQRIGIYVWAMGFMRVQTFITAGIGLPSNIASIVTLLNMHPMSSCSVVLIALAIVDFGYLLWELIFTTCIIHLGLYIPSEVCRLYFYFGSIMMTSSIWFMVAMTAERLLAVWLPLKVANICTVKRAAWTCVLIMFCVAALYIPYTYIPYSFQTPSGNWLCDFHPFYSDFISKWTVVDSSIYVLVPWPILAFCNGMIILGLHLSVKRKQRLTNSASQGEGLKNTHLSITGMLVTASVVSFLLISPNAIYYLYKRSSGWDYEATAQDLATHTFLHSLVHFLSNLNHAINFWLYVISGKRFRDIFFAILTCQEMGKARKYKSSGAKANRQMSVSQKVQETEITGNSTT